jgi:hypothetical protein
MGNRRKPLTVEYLSKIIISLIEAGNNLVDGASKCGHDEEVEAWETARKTAVQTFSSKELLKFKTEMKIAEEEKIRKAEEAFLEKRKLSDLKTLSEFEENSRNSMTNFTAQEKEAIKVLNFIASYDGIIRGEEERCYLLQQGILKFIAKSRQQKLKINEDYPQKIIFLP